MRMRIKRLLPFWMWLLVALSVPYQFMLQSLPTVMIDDLITALQITTADVGVLTASFFYTYLLFQIPAGALVDRCGVHTVMAVALLLAGLCCLGAAVAHSWWSICLMRLGMGLVLAPCVPAVMSLAATSFSTSSFVLLAGLAESLGMCGGAIGEAGFGHYITAHSWRACWLLCAFLGIILAIFVGFTGNNRRAGLRGGLLEPVRPGSRALWRDCFDMLLSRRLWPIALWAGCVFAVLPSLAGLWAIKIVQDWYSIPLSTAAWAGSALFFGTALGLPFWSWCAKRVGTYKKTMFWANVINMVLLVTLFQPALLSLLIVYMQLFIVGFVSAVYVLAFAIVREQVQPRVRASAMGLVNMMSMLIGAPLLQPVIGVVLSEHRPSWANALVAAVGNRDAAVLLLLVSCLFIALILLFFIEDPAHYSSQGH